MASSYPSPPSHSGLIIVTPMPDISLPGGGHRMMVSSLITPLHSALVQTLPSMRPIRHYDTTNNCVVPLSKAMLFQQFNAFVRYPAAQKMTNKAILESLRMINADQIHHQLRNFNDSRLNRCFDLLIVLLEERAFVPCLLRPFNYIRHLLRTRYRFENRMHQYYSTLPLAVRVSFEEHHERRRFAQDHRILISMKYILALVLSLRWHPRLMISVGNDENANPREIMDSAVEMAKVVGGHSSGEQNVNEADRA